MHCDECGTVLFEAGDVVPPGEYLRVDDGSFTRVVVARRGPIPASFDGHVASYRHAGAACACRRRAEQRHADENPLNTSGVSQRHQETSENL